jgi:hypothetical protein
VVFVVVVAVVALLQEAQDAEVVVGKAQDRQLKAQRLV